MIGVAQDYSMVSNATIGHSLVPPLHMMVNKIVSPLTRIHHSTLRQKRKKKKKVKVLFVPTL